MRETGHPTYSPVDRDNLDALFRALANECRRELVSVLERRATSHVDVETLAHQLAATGAVDDRTAVTELHHVHLPMLDEAGVLEYDHERGVVEYLGSRTACRLLSIVDGEF